MFEELLGDGLPPIRDISEILATEGRRSRSKLPRQFRVANVQFLWDVCILAPQKSDLGCARAFSMLGQN